jgi:hypothetical protein
MEELKNTNQISDKMTKLIIESYVRGYKDAIHDLHSASVSESFDIDNIKTKIYKGETK